MEVFFRVQKIVDDNNKIQVATLKLEGHVLVWWEAYCDAIKNGDEFSVSS